MSTTVTLPETVDYSSYKIKAFQPVLEFLFIAYILYQFLSVPMGFYVSLAGPVILFALTAWMFMLGGVKVFKNRDLLLILAISLIVVIYQFFFFGASIRNNNVSAFIIWAVMATLLFSLVRSPGFLARLAWAYLAIGLFTYPLRVMFGAYYRIRVETGGTALDSPNEYAAAISFSVVIFWLLAFNAKTLPRRLIYAAASLAGLYLTLQTVSRGALLAMVLATLVHFRPANLKTQSSRAIMVLVIIIITIGLIYVYLPSISGTFSRAIQSYVIRSTEDTGRTMIWRSYINKISESPLIGQGFENTLIRTVEGRYAAPHNMFLYLWVSSGIIPVLLLIWLLVRASIRSLRYKPAEEEIDPVPLIVYAGFYCAISSLSVLSVWGVAIFAYCATLAAPLAKAASTPEEGDMAELKP